MFAYLRKAFYAMVLAAGIHCQAHHEIVLLNFTGETWHFERHFPGDANANHPQVVATVHYPNGTQVSTTYARDAKFVLRHNEFLTLGTSAALDNLRVEFNMMGEKGRLRVRLHWVNQVPRPNSGNGAPAVVAGFTCKDCDQFRRNAVVDRLSEDVIFLQKDPAPEGKAGRSVPGPVAGAASAESKPAGESKKNQDQ